MVVNEYEELHRMPWIGGFLIWGVPQIIQNVTLKHIETFWNWWWLGDPPWLKKPAMKTCCSHGHQRGPHPPLKPGWKPRLIFPSLSSATNRFTCHESLTVTSKTNPTMIPNIFSNFSSYAVVYMYTYWYVLRMIYLYILYILYVYTCKVYTAYSIETSATQTCACFFFFFLGLHESELFSLHESQLQPRAATAPSSAPTWRVRSATSEDALCFRDESEPQPAGSPVEDAANYGGRNLMLVAWVFSKMGNFDFLILTWF
jgi:hypothetical protein